MIYDDTKKDYYSSFVPDQLCDYIIDIQDKDITISYIVTATTDGGTINPVTIGSYSLDALDGSDSIVLDRLGTPLNEVKVTIYDISNNNVAFTTFTNDRGEWQATVLPGTYFFSFEKDGYISMGFEKAVV
jgi:hypothetical protein